MIPVVIGCAPRDPLDREVEARTLADLRAWSGEIRADVEPGLAREIDEAFDNLAARTPRYRKPTTERELHERGNPLCRRVHGRTLREVLIDSYTATNQALAQSNSLDAENLLRLSTVVDPGRAEAFKRRADSIRELIVERDEQIRRNNERIGQLRGDTRS